MRFRAVLLLSTLAAAPAFWAFQPPARPVVTQHPFIRNPIDSFIYVALAKNGLMPNIAAQRHELIRRAYYDLHGVPPTATQTADFVSDTSAGAFSRLVDQLLASPRYDEKWSRLVEPAPLSPQVMVNRIWQQHFGRGLAFSHPELLDFLAIEFMEQGGSIEAMHRLIMDSDAYQRAAQPSDRALRKDPQNKWYSHFSRRRLTAEEIRDSVLQASGGRPPNAPLNEAEMDSFTTAQARSLGAALAARYADQELVRHAFRQVLTREPRMDDFRPALTLLEEAKKHLGDRAAAAGELCRWLMSLDDFLYVD